MSPEPASPKVPDEDKTRDQLLSELQELRAQLAILREAEVNSKSTAEAVRQSEARRNVAGAVEAERRRLFEVLENLPAMICLLTPDHHVAFANRSYRERFGESYGRRCFEHCFGRTGPCEFCECYNVLKTGRPHRWEVKAMDGSSIEVYNAPFTDVDGSPMVLKMSVDVTERKRAEEVLRSSESALKKAQEIARLGSWEWDLETNVVSGSEEMYHMFGLAPGPETFFQQYIDRLAPEDRRRVQAALNAAVEDNVPYDIDYEVVLPSGGQRFIHAEAVTSYEHGKPVKVFGTVQDITERKRADAALRDSEARLRQIIDTSPLPMVIYREEKNYYINRKFVETFGYTVADIPGIDEWWPLAYPDKAYRGFVKDRWYAALEDAVKNKTSIDPQEVTVTCKDGSKKDVLAFFSSIGDMNLAILQDITERKRAEKDLNTSKQQAELYLDLMGHDINNLHQIALGYLELARDMPAGEEQVMFLDKPIEVLQRSARLIGNVRKLQKLHDGTLQVQRVEVCKVLSDVQREYGAVPDKTITISLNGFERCHVRANGLLHDVFSNLVGNAIKHTGDRAAIVVYLDVVEDNGRRYCRVVVEDDGPGIPDDFKGVIFSRALKGTARAKGIGLGLYLVKSLVDSYNGKVWVEDRIKGDHTKGARFVVLLPAIDK